MQNQPPKAQTHTFFLCQILNILTEWYDIIVVAMLEFRQKMVGDEVVKSFKLRNVFCKDLYRKIYTSWLQFFWNDSKWYYIVDSFFLTE